MDHQTFDSLITGCFEHRLFAYMNLVGISKIEVEYSGGGDSGGMDSINFYPSEINSEINKNVTEGIRGDLEEQLSSAIYSRHGGFADGGGYYVNGSVLYDSDNKVVVISGTDHITEYGDEKEDGDYEEDTREEDWEETLFDANVKKSKEIDCQFAYMFARDVLGGQFDEEFHNKLITYAAINKDEFAEEYVDIK